MAVEIAERIVVDPDVMVGQPIIRGTRISVEFVLGLLADGWTEAEILEDYPHLVREDITACLAYARDVVSEFSVFPHAA
jgi:uncharacterized protein (DUF433 family)